MKLNTNITANDNNLTFILMGANRFLKLGGLELD